MTTYRVSFWDEYQNEGEAAYDMGAAPQSFAAAKRFAETSWADAENDAGITGKLTWVGPVGTVEYDGATYGSHSAGHLFRAQYVITTGH